MRVFTTIFLFASFFVGIVQAQSNIDPSLLEQFTQKEKVSFIVLFKEQANLDFIPRYAPKHVKGQLAYDQLREVAEKTQGNVQHLIKVANTPFRSFLLVNAIYVKGDLALAKQIASHSGIVTIQDYLYSQTHT